MTNRSLATPTDTPLVVTLTATDPNPNSLTLRIVEQPQHGAVAFDGTHATYRARDGFVGTDTFTYAAADGSSNSNLGTVTIAVGAAATHHRHLQWLRHPAHPCRDLCGRRHHRRF